MAAKRRKRRKGGHQGNSRKEAQEEYRGSRRKEAQGRTIARWLREGPTGAEGDGKPLVPEGCKRDSQTADRAYFLISRRGAPKLISSPCSISSLGWCRTGRTPPSPAHCACRTSCVVAVPAPSWGRLLPFPCSGAWPACLYGILSAATLSPAPLAPLAPLCGHPPLLRPLRLFAAIPPSCAPCASLRLSLPPARRRASLRLPLPLVPPWAPCARTVVGPTPAGYRCSRVRL
jgi:hypothetical protein